MVHGTAGVGKTTLALRWAGDAAPCYPDGQLHADLRGSDPAAARHPADVLHGFLRAMGVTAPDVPATLDERAALYRSLMSGRRMLVLLDNAGDADQVRPLLPGAGSPTAVVITSRDRLDALDGDGRDTERDRLGPANVRRLTLDRMPLDEAVELIAARYDDAVPADTAAELAELCARLPLALTLAAAATPAAAIGPLIAELRHDRTRVDPFAPGTPDIRTVFFWSYRRLRPGPARLFRLLGVHPGRTLDVPAAGALLGTSMIAARGHLATLARAHLVEEVSPGRYGTHDLLHAHALELADRHLDPAERSAALNRLTDHYLATAARADRIISPNRHRVSPSVTAPGIALRGYDEALAWLEEECPNLEALCRTGSVDGDPRCRQLASTLSGYLFLTKRLDVWERTHRWALRVAEGDRDGAGPGEP